MSRHPNRIVETVVYRLFREALEAIVLAMLIFFLASVTLQNFRVLGASMADTLQDGQFLVVNKVAYSSFDKARLAELVPFWSVDESEKVFTFHPPQRGEVIVFHPPRRPDVEYVKRVVAMPGETVEIHRGRVIVDGAPLEEPYILRESATETRHPLLLADDEYYVLGDNRLGSEDSRTWGPVILDSIVGRVWFTYWPLSDAGLISH